MAKKAKEMVIQELKEYIINKNARKKDPTTRVTSMITEHNKLLDKSHQIQLSDVENEAKRLATEEIRKKRSRFTGIMQHLAGTSSASKVEEIISNLKGVMNAKNTSGNRKTSTKKITQKTRD